MINIDNLAGWLGQQWDTATNAVATGISTATSWVEGTIESGMGWASTAATNAVDAVTTAATSAADAVTTGASAMVEGAVDSVTDWVSDLVPDGLLTSLGLGGGGLLAALLGFRLLRGAMGRQRGAAEYATFKVPAAIYSKLQGVLASAGITASEGEAVEGWTIFSVPRYHLGPTKRVLGGLGIKWEQIA